MANGNPLNILSTTINKIKRNNAKKYWTKLWIKCCVHGIMTKYCTRLALLSKPSYHERIKFSRQIPKGLISPTARIYHNNLVMGDNIFIDDNVLIYQDRGSGTIKLNDRVHINREIVLQTGQNGIIDIGTGTHIQQRCLFYAYLSHISIGSRTEIAANCSFYSYDHGMVAGIPIRKQPLTTRGGIVIEDDVWIGVGVTVLDGVKIAKGAVVGAGAVVTKDVPENSISAGNPAKSIGIRK